VRRGSQTPTLDDWGAPANIARPAKETMMNVAKYLLLAILMLPMAELAAFIAVAVAIGFFPALGLVIAGSFAGLLILQHAGGNHIGRMRVILNEGNFTSLEADGTGAATLLAGFLLLVPGFITDAAALLLLVVPLRRTLAAALRRGPPARTDGVVDLEPEQWRRVPDPTLPDRRERENDGWR
jgi:UPF0716 protein FxsA